VTACAEIYLETMGGEKEIELAIGNLGTTLVAI